MRDPRQTGVAHRIERIGTVLALTLAGLLPLSAPAMAADLASLTFQHAPNNPNVEGWVNISLDNAGNWTQVDTAVVPWRFSMEAVWNEPPTAYSFINLHIKPASLPAPIPPDDDCGGVFDPCAAWAPSPGGYMIQSVVPELTSSGPKIATVTAPLGEIDIAPGIFQNVTGACYTRRQNLLDDGANLHDLLAEGFVTDGTAMVAVLAVSPGGIFEIPIPFKVRCKGDPAIAELVAPKTNYQGSYATGYQLSEAAFNITPGFLKGVCPLQVVGQAIVAGNGAGAFRYRLEFDSGKTSQWSNASLLPKAGGGYARVLQIPIPLPLPAAQGSGSGGIVYQQPGSGLAIPQQPEEPVFPGNSGPSTPKQVAGIQEPDNVHKGAARLVVTKPDGSNKVVSAFDSYHVVCDKPKSVIFTGPKALQMQPTAPQPTVPATPQLRMAPQAVPAQPQRVTPQPQRVN
jgi:hypothetical protein